MNTESLSPEEPLRCVFEEALSKVRDRTERNGYGDAWRKNRTGLKGKYAQIETKVNRLHNQIWERADDDIPLAEALDSAQDLLNEAGFLVILLTERLANS